MQFLIDIGLSIIYFCFFLLLCAWTWRFWMMYINQKFINSMSWVMLEIKLPREITKSPLATEMALATLLQSGGIGNDHAKLFKGGLPAFSSLEIASIEGVIHFYIRIQKKFRPLVEANFYAQYPGIEIVEADDYTKAIRYHHLTKDVSMWGASYRTTAQWKPTNPETGKAYSKTLGVDKPPKDSGDEYSMKADFLPIKTYVDYELNKDPKEEFKIDPIAPLLEVMGSIGKGEHFWYQILVQDESVYKTKPSKYKMPSFYVNELTHQHVTLKEMADERKKQIRTAGWNIKGSVGASEFGVPTIIDSFIKKEDGTYEQQFEIVEKDGKITKVPKKVQAKHLETKAIGKKEMELTAEEKDELEIINKKFSKPLALCVMRFVYVTKSENFNPSHINNILSMPKAFNGINSLAPSPADCYDYPWQNMGGKRVAWRTEEMFEEYVEREGFFPHLSSEDNSFQQMLDRVFWTSTMRQRKVFHMLFESIFHPFNHPHADQAFTLNLEELATLWHLPGSTVATPTLPRIDSTKGVAPVNLPI
jgi:hypothetical protein